MIISMITLHKNRLLKQLPISFYERADVVTIARELLGKIVQTRIDGKLTSGRIVETEAYVAHTDRASHAYAGRRTSKNEHMYHPGGTTYVYICYGMHQMLNIVTNARYIPDAVLIRAIEPLKGVNVMLERTGKLTAGHTLTRGPGNVGKALGITKADSGKNILKSSIRIYADKDSDIPDSMVASSRRIGVESAGKDALLPYRFYIRRNRNVSGSPNK